MSRAVRAFLAWVMVFAMPVQGMAASTMLFCGPSHERVLRGPGADAPAAGPGRAGEAVHEHARAGHAVHDHVGQGGAAGAVAAPPSAGVGADRADSADSADRADGAASLVPDHGQFGCSACAACCSVLALPASFSLPEVAGPAHPMLASPSAPAASPQPDRLDRPPRACA